MLFEDCYEFALTFPIDLEAASRLLPEALEPARYSRAATAQVPPGSYAQLRAPVWTCHHSVGGRDLGNFWQMYIYLLVRPPEGFELQGASGHSYIIAALADSEAMVEVYDAWGVPALKLDEIAGLFSHPGAARPGPVRARASAGDIEVTLEGNLTVDSNARPRRATGSWRFLTTTGHERVIGAADLEWGDEASIFARGRGRLTYSDGSISITTEEGTITYLGDEDWDWRLVYTPDPR